MATIGFEEKLWASADKLRNNMDAAEYKHVVLGFIYYNLISEDFKSFIYGISAGTSTQPNMKIDHMLQYKITDFDIEEQEKIANILSSLDDKIDLNNEMNKTLEEMAKSIFKRW